MCRVPKLVIRVQKMLWSGIINYPMFSVPCVVILHHFYVMFSVPSVMIRHHFYVTSSVSNAVIRHHFYVMFSVSSVVIRHNFYVICPVPGRRRTTSLTLRSWRVSWLSCTKASPLWSMKIQEWMNEWKNKGLKEHMHACINLFNVTLYYFEYRGEYCMKHKTIFISTENISKIFQIGSLEFYKYILSGFQIDQLFVRKL